jgi:hypothetical protein
MEKLVAAIPLLTLLVGCPTPSDSPPVVTPTRGEVASACPWEAPAPPSLPYQRSEHGLAAYWLSRANRDSSVILTPEQITAHNKKVQGITVDGWQRGRWDLLTLSLDQKRVQGYLRSDVEALREATAKGKRVLASGKPLLELLDRLQQQIEKLQPADEVRVAHRSTPLRCYPTDLGIFESARETAFDLAQCAQLRLGEPVRVFAKGETFWYVWSSYASGFVHATDLTPPLTPEDASAFLEPRRFVVIQRDQLPLWSPSEKGGQPESIKAIARLGVRLPLLAEEKERLKVSIPTAEGLGEAWVLDRDAVSVGFPPLTWEALLQRAFELVNSTYGWGGMGEHRDCSRLLMDLFGAFGVLLPRNSKRQSMAGTRQVEVEHLDETKKVEAIEQAARRAVVLLYLPGHIMLYLGREGEQLYALHQFSGYLVPCKGGGETMMRVNRTTVTALELGRGSSRKSFIERVTRLVLLEPPQPGDKPDAAPNPKR